jgi:hypothetical protein
MTSYVFVRRFSYSSQQDKIERMRRIGARWMQLARSAALVQSNVLLWLFYVVLWVPLGLTRRLFADPLARHAPPAWRERPASSHDLASVRRQF